MTPETKQKLVRDRWRNRRRMAWISLIGALVFPFILILIPDGGALATIAIPFYTFVSAVVTSYVGFSTWDDININPTVETTRDDTPN